MAFWGVEVRPGKPFTHNFDESRGRLRITQATLSDGKSTGKSIMQCNVGNKSPVLLCSLIPNLSETCHLELEFEEDEKVTFSVLGQRSIHLAGYFLSHGHNLGGGDSDSHGEDIAESDTSGSYSHGSEDEYESDFIDDGDIEIYSDFPVHKSSVVIEEIEDEDKLSNVNRKLLRLRKKYEHSDPVVTETGTKQLIVSNNESGKVVSEDEDGFPILFSMGGENFKNKKINRDKKRKIDGVIQDNVPLSDEATENHGLLVPSEVATDVKKKSKKKQKGKEGKHNIVSEIDEKPKDQDDSTNVGNNSEIDAKVSTVNNEEQALGTLNGAVDTDNEPYPKKSKKKKTKDIAKEATLDEEDSSKQLNMPEVVKEDDGRPFDGPNADASPATTGGNTARKKKKKNKKNKCDLDIKQVVSAEGKAELDDGFDGSNHDPKASKTRTFPNGLIVEEVSMGKPDGKRASPGKKVSVHYIGKLKNGSIFDSNIGQKPFKFRLGIGEVIKGWDTGVNGMRVGDKRRLTIPPSFGYGAKGVGKIPPNSWLIFDVELVDVQ